MRTHGNEIADRLAKEAARSKDTETAFSRIQISTLYYELEEARQQWQKEWENCTKAATTKEYFPTIQERLSMKISVTPNTATMVTGHGKTWAYLHRFKLLDNATCVCKQGDQTTDHLLDQCNLLEKQRGILKKNNCQRWTLACKQTGINHEVRGIIYNLYRINRF